MDSIYHAAHLKRNNYSVSLAEQDVLLEKLKSRADTEGRRLQSYLALSDLTRLEGNPVKAVTDRILNLPSLRNFDLIDTPSIIAAEVVFDLFNFPKDHPARSRSDTYYVDEKHILRPHTSMMWKYYFDIPEVREKLEKYGSVGAISYGTVFRRDEIDWQHTNVLHHIDGLFVCKKNIKDLKQSDLEDILWEVAHSLFGNDIKGRFNVEHYPYTDPSLEMEIAWDNKWVEILGAGLVHPQVLKNLGINPDIYCGWAFGFGADRLAMIKMGIPDIRLLRSDDDRVLKQFKNIDQHYQPVSKYPPVVRDISFVVDRSKFNLNRYYEVVREVIGDEFIEEVKILDNFDDEQRFSKGKTSYTFRTTYRHLDRTLTNAEVDEMHKKLEDRTKAEFSAVIR